MAQLKDQVFGSAQLSAKIQQVLTRRTELARKRFSERAEAAWKSLAAAPPAQMATPLGWYKLWTDYAVDYMQRSILFCDTLRQRGNNYLEHERAGKPPVLHFEYEIIQDGRDFDRPVNYALLRIEPPEGVTIDPQLRPYVVIDPRAGHGPGIGGFKDDSQVGVALRSGHPVYFVVFFPEPEPGQTLLDVCAAEAKFVHKVRELHPDSPKPAIVGNCQGGWAAMMLAASDPANTGAVIINGAPMSYWGGAWAEGEGDNPMRYAGGLLGGSWLASLASDLGGGKFDGAHLVQNFEALNPANTFWNKYYHLFANIDTEPPRFLEFERWWGGFFLMNREEIEWIVRNLFVGNKLWTDGGLRAHGKAFDLRDIRAPIVLFASMGDNITPPQQAFNWVADIYGSTEEIKARGQTIVGLMHQDIGHLGIFVSGRVAKKEHAQIVSVLEYIEHLPPGLWQMQIHERKGSDGGVEYLVDFTERTLEEVIARLNRFERKDEKVFESAAAVSELNQRIYEIFARPFIQNASTDFFAEMGRQFHPLRFSRWAASDTNPAMWWLGPAAAAVSANRHAVGPDHPLRRSERFTSEMISAAFDFYRDLRDALSEAAFFQTYGQMMMINPPAARDDSPSTERAADPRQLSYVRDALQAVDKGGYEEAVARAAFMLARKGEPLPLWRLRLRDELAESLGDLLPKLSQEEWRRLRGVQEIITQYEPQQALTALPALLSKPQDRQRFLTLLDRLLTNAQVQASQPTPEQHATLARIRQVLSNGVQTAARTQPRRAGKVSQRMGRK